MIPIASSPLFNGLDPAALTDIMDRLRRRHYQPDEHLCRLGVPGTACSLSKAAWLKRRPRRRRNENHPG